MRKIKVNEYVAVSLEIEEAARADYEAARKHVGGRPRWEKLDPYCAYDMGMRNHAIDAAKISLELAETATFVNEIVAAVPFRALRKPIARSVDAVLPWIAVALGGRQHDRHSPDHTVRLHSASPMLMLPGDIQKRWPS